MGFPLRSEFVRLWRNPPRPTVRALCGHWGLLYPPSHQTLQLYVGERTHLLLPAPGERRQLRLLSTSHGPGGARGALPCQGGDHNLGMPGKRLVEPHPCPPSLGALTRYRGAEGAAWSCHSVGSRDCSLSPEVGTDPALAIRGCKPVWEELAPGSKRRSLAHSSPTLVPLGLCASCQT